MAGSLLAGRVLAALLLAVTVALLARTATNLRALDVPARALLPAGTKLSTGQEAPDFRLATIAGDSLSLGSLRGRVVVVDFWATWCGPCQQELPALQRLYEEHAARGLEIVAISVDAGPEAVAPYARQARLTFPVVLGGIAVQTLYRVTALPTLFLVDRAGVIRFYQIGYAPGSEAALAAQVEALLAEG